MIKCKVITPKAIASNSGMGKSLENKVNEFFEGHPQAEIIYAKYDGFFFCLYEEKFINK